MTVWTLQRHTSMRWSYAGKQSDLKYTTVLCVCILVLLTYILSERCRLQLQVPATLAGRGFTISKSCHYNNNNNNNNNGHFYGAWSVARSRAQCTVQKAAEKCINTYNGKIKKGFGPHNRQPCKNVRTAFSVNKPKLSVTKHDQTLICQ